MNEPLEGAGPIIYLHLIRNDTIQLDTVNYISDWIDSIIFLNVVSVDIKPPIGPHIVFYVETYFHSFFGVWIWKQGKGDLKQGLSFSWKNRIFGCQASARSSWLWGDSCPPFHILRLEAGHSCKRLFVTTGTEEFYWPWELMVV